MKEITVFFRYDDFSETSPIEVDSGLISVLRRHHVPCTFAVIPAVTDGNYRDPAVTEVRLLGAMKLEMLSEAVADGAVDVALHGLNHRTRFKDGPHSEFVGLSREIQASMIQEGKQRLERSLGVPIGGFVPPWNNYDANTLAALQDSGIHCLSANRSSPSLNVPGIRYLPITIETHELRNAVTQARRSRDSDPIIGVLLHPYDFKESGDSRARMTCLDFENELKWLLGQADVRIMPVSKIFEQNPTLGVARFRANKPTVFENIFPPFVRRTVDTPLYLTAGSAKAARIAKLMTTAGFHLGAAVFAYFLGAWALSSMAMESKPLLSVVKWLMLGALVVLTIRLGITKKLYFRAMVAWLGLAGLSLALAGV
jgi:peptidoglycan/xylan/chitin deacetylase (PgdA/CDA1 family)